MDFRCPSISCLFYTVPCCSVVAGTGHSPTKACIASNRWAGTRPELTITNRPTKQPFYICLAWLAWAMDRAGLCCRFAPLSLSLCLCLPQSCLALPCLLHTVQISDFFCFFAPWVKSHCPGGDASCSGSRFDVSFDMSHACSLTSPSPFFCVTDSLSAFYLFVIQPARLPTSWLSNRSFAQKRFLFFISRALPFIFYSFSFFPSFFENLRAIN